MKKSNNLFETLHCHTKISDGNMTYEEVLELCGKYKIGTVAFTDHDSLPDNKSYKKLKDLKNISTKWVVGIEISADKPKDFAVDFTPHIVGLFVDPYNRKLIKHCNLAQEARRKRMSEMVKHLKKLGFIISEADCLNFSNGESVGRPHIVQAIKSKAYNLKIIEKLRKKMQADSKNNEKVKLKYDEMMKRGSDQYPYVLFLSDDSYIKGVYVDYIYRIDLDACVEIIRGAGGAAFFAHWFTEIKKCKEDDIEKLLKEGRLDGVETVYGLYDDIKDKFLDQRKILRNLIERYNKLESGGVDAHLKEHLIEFSENNWYARLTKGFAERMIESGKVDANWSSYQI